MFNVSKIPYYLGRIGFLKWMPDDLYLKLVYRCWMGKTLNLENPKTFSEKLQWLKLYNRKQEYSIMADKYAARKYISDIIGEEYLVPLIGVWNDPDEINIDSLPRQFVLKCNHNSEKGLCICKDKSKLNFNKVRRELRKGIREDYYQGGREWQYKNISRKIICEKYLEDGTGDVLQDFKLFCFNGEPKLMYVSREASNNPETDFFDMEFNRIPMQMKDPNSNRKIEKPVNFDLMKEISRKLAENIPFLRVDFYEINEKLYVGELTFFHNSGFVSISPEEYNTILGDYIVLPEIVSDR